MIDLVERLRTSWDVDRSIISQTSGWDRERKEAADEITALRARLDAVEKRAESARWNVDENGNLVRLCRGDHDKDENCSDHEELFVPLERAERAEAALATARRDALEEALGKCVAVRDTDQCGSGTEYDKGHKAASSWCCDEIENLKD